MNFGVPWPWWWNALMQLAGLLEASAPFGVLVLAAFYFFAVIDGNGRTFRRIRKWLYPRIEEEGK